MMTQFFFVPLLAAGVAELQTQLGQALKLIMMVGFLFGVVLILKGAFEIRRGESGKDSILGGILIAAAPAIMYALYEIFLKGGSAPTF